MSGKHTRIRASISLALTALPTISGQFLDNVRASTKTSAADLLWGEALNDEADLKTTLAAMPRRSRSPEWRKTMLCR